MIEWPDIQNQFDSLKHDVVFNCVEKNHNQFNSNYENFYTYIKSLFKIND